MAGGKNHRKKKHRQFHRHELDRLRQFDPQQHCVRRQQLFDRWTDEAIACLRAGKAEAFRKVMARVLVQLGEENAALFKLHAAEAIKAPAASLIGWTDSTTGEVLLDALRQVFGADWVSGMIRKLVRHLEGEWEQEVGRRADSLAAAVWWLVQVLSPYLRPVEAEELRALVVRRLEAVGQSVRTALPPTGSTTLAPKCCSGPAR